MRASSRQYMRENNATPHTAARPLPQHKHKIQTIENKNNEETYKAEMQQAAVDLQPLVARSLLVVVLFWNISSSCSAV
jgi:hypothetical protein